MFKNTYFTNLNKDLIQGAKYAVIPGDPKRVESLAKAIDKNATFISKFRQHTAYIANIMGSNILIISSGMGCPAITKTVEELVSLGIENFIRIGTSGTIKESINLGDIVISKAAVKLEGASSSFLEEGYPAIPSFSLTESFVKAAQISGVSHHLGITVSSDTFWQGQERYDNYTHDILRKFKGSIKEWQSLNVSNLEMEASALFTICQVYKVKAACFCGIIAKRTDSEKVNLSGKATTSENWEKLLKVGLELDITLNKTN